MVFGVGIDIIEVDRVKKLVAHSSRFIERIYTPAEIAYCESKKNKAQNYAARFAAKEAFMKAIGTGWSSGMAFKDIEVRNAQSGKPELILHGKAKEFIDKENVTSIQVSLSHLKNIASAIVTIEK